MNLATRNYLIKCFILPIAILILIAIVSLGSATISMYNAALTIGNSFLTLYFYFYLIDDRAYNFHMQLPIKRIVKLFMPVVAIYSINIIFDVITLVFFKEEFMLINIIVKYFNVSTALLIILASNSYRKIIIAFIINLLAFNNSTSFIFAQLFQATELTLFNFTIITIINFLPLFCAYYLYRVRYFIHDNKFINMAYYWLMVLYAIIFFLKFFISKYPFVNNLYTINIFGYNISVFLYLLVFLFIIMWVVWKQQRLDIKKIIKMTAPVILVTMIYMISDRVSEVADVNCRYVSKLQNHRKNDGSSVVQVQVGYNTVDVDVNKERSEAVQAFLASGADSCYFNRNINQYRTIIQYDLDEVNKRKQQLITYGRMTYLVDNKEKDIADLIEIANSKDIVNYISIAKDNTEYRLAILQSNVMENSSIIEKLKEVDDEDKNVKLKIASKDEGKKLFDKVLEYINENEYSNIEEGDEVYLVKYNSYSITKNLNIDDNEYQLDEQYLKEVIKYIEGGQ